jgi:hypothetical protein
MPNLDSRAILDKIVSHAAASGYFDRVNQHELIDPAGTGLVAGVWTQEFRPVRSSGLNTVSMRLTVFVRIYTSMVSEPMDEIDPNVLDATDALLAAYCGDFELGGTARHIDIFGAAGLPLDAQAGYVERAGGLIRVMTVTVPVIVNDLYAEVA